MAVRANVRTLAICLAVVAIAVLARWYWDRLTGPQRPAQLFDSESYLEVAAQPLGPSLVFAAKPLTVPLIYRAAGRDPLAILRVQRELAFAGWALLTVAIACSLRRRWAKAAAVAVGLAFLFAVPRVGWAGLLLSESISDSAMALVVACAVGLIVVESRWARGALIAALVAVGLAWLFSRDTNAVGALIALVVAALVWPVRRWWAERRWAAAVGALVVVASLISIWSTSVVPDGPPPTFQQYWDPPFNARAGFPLLDNVVSRMMLDRAWFAEQGAPVDALDRFTKPKPLPHVLVQRVPENAAAQAWIVEHGRASYLRWLIRRPLDRLGELIDARWTVLSSRLSVHAPEGWVSRDHAHPLLHIARQLTVNEVILLVLLFASPLLLWRPRRHPLIGIALCLVISGAVSAVAAYYGDAAELARHCYGAGQQIVLGWFLALLAWADGAVRPRRRAS